MSSVVVPRPRSATEILDASVQLVRQHFGSLVVLTALCYVPFVVFRTLLHGDAGIPISGNPSSARELRSLAWLVGGVIWYEATSVVALILAASVAYFGERVEIAATLHRMVRCVPSVLALIIVALGVVSLVTLLAALPAVVVTAAAMPFGPPRLAGEIGVIVAVVGILLVSAYLSAALFASLPIVALEHLHALEAIRRSAHLTQGLRAHILRLIGLVYAVFVLPYYATVWILSAAGHPTLTSIVTVALGVIVGPFTRTAMVVLYYELRIRKEGYDISLMARAVAAPVTPQVA